jgi:geranylgeranyl reductase family protein
MALTGLDAARRDGRGPLMTALDAIVVGAGPAGSAVAAALSRVGARVVLVERAHHPRPKACAEYASPRIVDELARIGLPFEAWSTDAVPLSGMHLHAGGRVVRIEYADRTGRRPAWGVDRRRFDARLAEHAAASGAELREGVAVVDVSLDDGRVTGVRLRDLSDGRDEALRAPWVIGADGARSSVARLLGVERRVGFPRRLGLVAHHSGIPALTDHGEMHVGNGYYVGLAPTPGGELNVGMALPLADGGRPAAARFDGAVAGIPAVARRLRETARLTPIRGAAPIGHRVADVAGPGWLLIGDAAGFVDPFTGEGIHRALRSARAAAEAIIGGGDVASTYRRERRRAFAAKSALSWLVQGFLAAPPLLEHAVARLADRPEAALRLGSALGDCRPATDALSPRALLDVLRP